MVLGGSGGVCGDIRGSQWVRGPKYPLWGRGGGRRGVMKHRLKLSYQPNFIKIG